MSRARGSADAKDVCRRLWGGLYAADLFGGEECSALVKCADGLPGWRAAIVKKGGDAGVRRGRRRARQLAVTGEQADAGARTLFEPVLERLERWMRELDRQHFHAGIRGIRDAQLVEYVRGGFFAWHADARDPAFRKLTALCYLTDHASDGLVGGETQFAPPPFDRLPGISRRRRSRGRGGRWHGWLPGVHAPLRGRALAFDASLRHRALRVRAGRKVSLNVWFA